MKQPAKKAGFSFRKMQMEYTGHGLCDNESSEDKSMDKKKYAVTGSWDWDGSTSLKGLTLFSWDEKTGDLEFLENILPDAKIGFTPVKGRKGVYYTVEETKTSDGRAFGGGGYLLAFKKTADEHLKLLNRVPSLATNPSGCALSADGKYLVAVHHTSTKNTATKMVRRKNGTIANKVVHDDAAIVLFRIESDGRIGGCIDYIVPKDEGDKVPLLHSVYNIPKTDLFIICDKGLDRIYTYRLQDEQLVLCDTLKAESGSSPRYGVFHPKKPIFYAVNEARTTIGTYLYDTEEGSLFCAGVTEMMDEPLIGMPSDVVVTPDGKHLYAALRMCDRIAEMDIGSDGVPVLVRTVDGGGRNSRGIQIDKKGRYLYVCNTESDVLTLFAIQKNGRLEKKKEIMLERAANMRFLD
ncbi:MAG TPA: hypothetical protein DHW39_01100 [Erysipelotrichaceae bacterium]|nr:hypothetical protein [Erysipelotrichaceae bacterium]